ncbi:hypothetical protein [Primorskyibacter flagellatus]|uniref:hypothetical protein n=1 Tax=Primorskyibacter flagellatus TaxID=1387277 RepID=UPI003A8DFB22
MQHVQGDDFGYMYATSVRIGRTEKTCQRENARYAKRDSQHCHFTQQPESRQCHCRDKRNNLRPLKRRAKMFVAAKNVPDEVAHPAPMVALSAGPTLMGGQ